MPKYVIYHEADGIYLGNALGLGFWANCDPAGQVEAVTFDSEDSARRHIASWENPKPMEEYRVVPVPTEAPHATKSVCMQAGLPGW